MQIRNIKQKTKKYDQLKIIPQIKIIQENKNKNKIQDHNIKMLSITYVNDIKI